MFIATGKDTLGIVFDLMGRLCGWHGWNTVVVLGKKPIAGIGIVDVSRVPRRKVFGEYRVLERSGHVGYVGGIPPG